MRSDVEINSILFNGNVWLILNDWTEIKNVLLMVCEDDVWTRFLLMRYRQNGVIRACHNSVARLLCRNSLMCFFTFKVRQLSVLKIDSFSLSKVLGQKDRSGDVWRMNEFVLFFIYPSLTDWFLKCFYGVLSEWSVNYIFRNQIMIWYKERMTCEK